MGQDHGDELLESARLAEDVRAHVERLAEECLQRLEEPAGRGGVGVDLGLDCLLARVGRFELHPERPELARDRTPSSVVR
jgi:hypothetical protein